MQKSKVLLLFLVVTVMEKNNGRWDSGSSRSGLIFFIVLFVCVRVCVCVCVCELKQI